MGFGFGAGSDMMKAYKANKRQLKKGKSLQDNYDAKATSGLKFKEASEQEVKDFKEKFKEKQRQEKRKNLIVLGAIIIATFLTAIIVLF